MAYALFVDASGSGYGGAHLTFCYRGEGRPVERRGISFLIRPLPYQGIVVPTAAQLAPRLARRTGCSSTTTTSQWWSTPSSRRG